jgi:hypothetical protein
MARGVFPDAVTVPDAVAALSAAGLGANETGKDALKDTAGDKIKNAPDKPAQTDGAGDTAQSAAAGAPTEEMAQDARRARKQTPESLPRAKRRARFFWPRPSRRCCGAPSQLPERRWAFLSLFVLLAAFVPFALRFERRRPQARELVLLAALSSIAVASRAACYMLPQLKPMGAFVVITGVCLGPGAGFLVGALSAFVSNFFFGQGPWTPWQMLCFGAIGFLAGVLIEKRKPAPARAQITRTGLGHDGHLRRRDEPGVGHHVSGPACMGDVCRRIRCGLFLRFAARGVRRACAVVFI